MATPPAASASRNRTTVTGVTSGPPTGAGAGWAIAWLAMARVLVLVFRVHAVGIALRDEGEAREERDRRDHSLVDRLGVRLRDARVGALGERGLAQPLDGHRREVQHLRAAHLAFAVHVVDVLHGLLHLHVLAVHGAARVRREFPGLQRL